MLRNDRPYLTIDVQQCSHNCDVYFGHGFVVHWSMGQGYKKPGIISIAFTSAAMPRLSQNDRERAVGMLMARTPYAQVARRFRVYRSTIQRLQTRLQQTGSTHDRPRSGQPCVTTPVQDRHIRVMHLRWTSVYCDVIHVKPKNNGFETWNSLYYLHNKID